MGWLVMIVPIKIIKDIGFLVVLLLLSPFLFTDDIPRLFMILGIVGGIVVIIHVQSTIMI